MFHKQFLRDIPQREITFWNTNFYVRSAIRTRRSRLYLVGREIVAIFFMSNFHAMHLFYAVPYRAMLYKYLYTIRGAVHIFQGKQNFKIPKHQESVARRMKWWKICSASKLKRFQLERRELSILCSKIHRFKLGTINFINWSIFSWFVCLFLWWISVASYQR